MMSDTISAGRSASAFSSPSRPSIADTTCSRATGTRVMNAFMSAIVFNDQHRGSRSRRRAVILGRLDDRIRRSQRRDGALERCRQSRRDRWRARPAQGRRQRRAAESRPRSAHRRDRIRATAMRPLCSSTNSLAIASPSPVPPRARLLPPSACRKRSNTACRISGLTPGPESSTASVRSVAEREARSRTRPPSGANLNALPSRFINTRCSFSASTAVAPGHRRRS